MTTTTLDHTYLRLKDNEVDVKVSTDFLRDEGWIPEDEAAAHCGHDIDEERYEARSEALQPAERGDAADVLEQFHNDKHAGPYKFCYERPCHEIRKAVG